MSSAEADSLPCLAKPPDRDLPLSHVGARQELPARASHRGRREGYYLGDQWRDKTYVSPVTLRSLWSTHPCHVLAAAAGIDAEVADFFASQSQGPVEIDEETDRRLRWMIHKRVLVRIIVLEACTLLWLTRDAAGHGGDLLRTDS